MRTFRTASDLFWGWAVPIAVGACAIAGFFLDTDNRPWHEKYGPLFVIGGFWLTMVGYGFYRFVTGRRD
jgi:hypothetical protein